tara:strand:- start:227 stop:451 length:225 start_codon:yes stop_codon:yes gene_type:complete
MSRIIFFLTISLFTTFLAHGQCAMCRVVAESSQANGSGIANGLNSGILYLMIFPYILIGIGLVTMYMRQKEQSN